MYFRGLSLAFAAGAFGGLVNSVVLWLCGFYGLTARLGVKIAPALTPAWLYPRIVWGGLFGLLFCVAFTRNSAVRQGFLVSLAPTAAQLLYVFPFMQGQGWFGMKLGVLTPLLVLLMNAVWGIAAALWLRASEGR